MNKKDTLAYEAFDQAATSLLGEGAATILEILRLALADSDNRDRIGERMDLSEESLYGLTEEVIAVTDGVLLYEDPEDEGTEGQDRESYSDDQDREFYTVSGS